MSSRIRTRLATAEESAQLVGPLPGDLNNVTTFSAGIGPASKDAAAAKAFIQYVTGPVGAGALKSKGMDPS